jgi:hypothetical protein
MVTVGMYIVALLENFTPSGPSRGNRRSLQGTGGRRREDQLEAREEGRSFPAE